MGCLFSWPDSKRRGDSKGTSPEGGKGIRWMAFQFPGLAAALPQCRRTNPSFSRACYLPQGQNRAGDAILAAGKSCQAGLRGAKRKQADADDRFRIPPLLIYLPQCRRTNPSFSRVCSLFPPFTPYRRGRENSLFSFPRISSIIYEGEFPEKGYAKGVSLWI